MRSLFIFLIFLVWALIGWCYWSDWNECCNDKATSGIGTESSESVLDSEGEETASLTEEAAEAKAIRATVEAARARGVPVFNWSSENPILSNKWASFRDSIVQNLGDDRLLQISGLYRNSEENGSDYDNLGIARSQKIKELFSGMIDDDRIRILGMLTDEKSGESGNVVEGIDFAFGAADDKVIEIRDRAVIYFPSSSTDKLDDAEVEAYLDDVVKRITGSGERVMLSGHSDSTGDAAANLRLSQARADVIKNYLVSKGVPATKIVITAMGETQPVATNTTAQGRAQNRRTELRIIQ